MFINGSLFVEKQKFFGQLSFLPVLCIDFAGYVTLNGASKDPAKRGV
jgi:hypothetical protein